MYRGFIKTWRKIRDSFLWEDKPFSLGQAWIDLVMEANHKDKEVLFRQRPEQCKRGQIITSILKLSSKWGWDRKKVKRWLNQFQKEDMIRYNIQDKRFILITICNYEIYQEKKERKGQQKGQQKGQEKDKRGTTEGQERDINKNDKNVKNDKNNTLSFDDWKIYTNDALQNLLSDIAWIKKINIDYPSLNVKRTTEKAFESFFSTEDGYVYRKGNPNCNWKNAMNYQLGPKGAYRVWNNNKQETPDYSNMP